MKTYRVFLPLLACAALVAPAGLKAADAETAWQTDLKKAQEQAKHDHKLMLVNFTGSDWCGWCIKLDREVFSQPKFREYAGKNLVLLEVDFPRRKEQSDALKKQNEELAMKYRVMGFPTLLVLDGDGKAVGALSFEDAIPAGRQEPQGDAATFVAALEKLKKS